MQQRFRDATQQIPAIFLGAAQDLCLLVKRLSARPSPRQRSTKNAVVGSAVASDGLKDGAPSEFEGARARFARLIDDKLYPGGQLAIRMGGREVVRWASGMARGVRDTDRVEPVAMRDDTLVPVFSAGKPLVALAIMLLEEQGKLDVEEPLAKHIPGFDACGKSGLTVLDVLTHRSGVLAPS